MAPRRKRKAKAVAEDGGFLVQFVPGGFYHYSDGQLYTGVHRRAAGRTITEKLVPLARKAAETPTEWVTL